MSLGNWDSIKDPANLGCLGRPGPHSLQGRGLLARSPSRDTCLTPSISFHFSKPQGLCRERSFLSLSFLSLTPFLVSISFHSSVKNLKTSLGGPSSVASHKIRGKSFHLSEPQMPHWEAITSGSMHRL